MGKLADYAEQAKEVERLVQEERYSIENALKIVKEKKKKATKNPVQSVPSSICKITVPLYHENRKEEKLNG
ncbi:hypothetical protein SR42_15380 [Clostridium botulinum]|uniref:hypothetical protein n=1 Tax=Clostridium TaxID=1485 RepID=UPI0002F68E92|nr:MULTISPECIES: hypothetical protein [Clostridium]KIL06944.1 hypothetical protein SR42_15380 [Clostridium botulinum]MBY6935249.1 hypothetical protein [Clostridium botulinum]NFI30665.1 hypothetical protein [Clostridium botulinum]NFL82115.1 hypothetical protein [Clostridium botulinum]NFN12704.1 hypothetical protein [Clostridium botulinum]